jgi:hypothetical protein
MGIIANITSGNYLGAVTEGLSKLRAKVAAKKVKKGEEVTPKQAEALETWGSQPFLQSVPVSVNSNAEYSPPVSAGVTFESAENTKQRNLIYAGIGVGAMAVLAFIVSMFTRKRKN